MSHKIRRMVIVIVGGAGSAGLARALASELGWPWIEADRLRTPLARAAGRRERLIVLHAALSRQEREQLHDEVRGVRFVYPHGVPGDVLEGDFSSAIRLGPGLDLPASVSAIRRECGV
ncbi:MAG: hypothetical protein IT176_03070 [Acidobacteria bacterium]|nr:hypothetical protein [Acidobacteriota bacterium]